MSALTYHSSSPNFLFVTLASDDRFEEAEQLSIALQRVCVLGEALSSAHQAQMQAAEREDFDLALKFRDKAREAEVWQRQAVQDASVSS